MNQEDLKAIEKKITNSYRDLSECINELAGKIKELEDHLMIAIERIQELEDKKRSY